MKYAVIFLLLLYSQRVVNPTLQSSGYRLWDHIDPQVIWPRSIKLLMHSSIWTPPHQMEFLILTCRALASAPCSPGSRPGRLRAPRSGCGWGSSSAIAAGLGAGLNWAGQEAWTGVLARQSQATFSGGRRDANGTAARPVVVVATQSTSDIARFKCQHLVN